MQRISCSATLQDTEQEVEAARLGDKLRTGLVQGVWLQMGTDQERLAAALEFIDAAFTEHCALRRPQIYGKSASAINAAP